jgi:hypothetical protein
MGIEERFVDPNTQEAPLPEYNKIVSPLNNPYHYIYDNENYFEEWGDPPSEAKFGCLIAVRGTFDGFANEGVLDNPSTQTTNILFNDTQLLICGNSMPLGTGASKMIEDTITNYMSNTLKPGQEVTFFIQPCNGTPMAGVPDQNAPFKKTYKNDKIPDAVKDILKYYGVSKGGDFLRYGDIDRRIFKEIKDQDFFDHDCRVPYVEDAYRLYTRIGEAFYNNGRNKYMKYRDPNWKWSQAPSTRTIDGYSYLQIKVFDLGLYPDQCNRIYRAAYYDYQEYLPKWCTPLYSTAWKQIQKSHTEVKMAKKIKYVTKTKIEKVKVGEETVWEDRWIEDSIESINTVMAPYSSSEKAIMEFIPAEEYNGSFAITMNTGHWYGFIIKEFNYNKETGETIGSGTVIGGSGFAYRGTWTFNKNTTQITADNRSAVAMSWSDRSTYYGDWTMMWDGHNQNYGYRDTLYRYQCNKRYHDFIAQYQNNKPELDYDTVLEYFRARKQYLENRKIQLQTDSRIGTDSNWAWNRDTFYNNKELSEITETYNTMLNYTQAQKNACNYDYVLNDYLSILDSSFTHEYSSYNQKLKAYSDKYGLTYTLAQHPHAVDGGILIEPQMPEAPKNNGWGDYANHDTSKALKINSFGNLSFHTGKKYIIYTRECPGGGEEAEKFIYQSFDVDYDFNVKALTKKDKKVPKYEDQEIEYQEPVQYIAEEPEEVYEWEEVEVVDYMYLQYYDEEDRENMLKEIGKRVREIRALAFEMLDGRDYYSVISQDYISMQGISHSTALKLSKLFHDYLIRNCHYGESEFSKSFYAPFSSGKYSAESEGFALAYKFLCNRYSIPTQIMTGYNFIDVKTGQQTPEGIFHAWNRTLFQPQPENEVEQPKPGCLILVGGEYTKSDAYALVCSWYWKGDLSKVLNKALSDLESKVSGGGTWTLYYQKPVKCWSHVQVDPSYIKSWSVSKSNISSVKSQIKTYFDSHIFKTSNNMPDTAINGDDYGDYKYRYFRKYGINHIGEYNCAKVIEDAIQQYDQEHANNYSISGTLTSYEDLQYSKKWNGKVSGFPASSYYNQQESHSFYNGYYQFDHINWIETDVCLDHPDFYKAGSSGASKPRGTFFSVNSNRIYEREDAGYRITGKYLYTNYGFECYANFVGQDNHYGQITSSGKIKDESIRDFLPTAIFDPDEEHPWVPMPGA